MPGRSEVPRARGRSAPFLATTAATLVAILAAGTALLVNAADRDADHDARRRLERATQSIENTLNRQLLQVDGALASMPEILANVRGATLDHGTASRILGDLNFQTAAFRDLLVVLEDGSVWASARKGRTNGTVGRALAQARHKLTSGAATVVGPLRNQVTGDWSIYLARAVTLPTVGSSLAAAEIPVPLLVRLLSENTVEPGTRVQIRRGDGQLLASVPADEQAIGQRHDPAPGTVERLGSAFELLAEGDTDDPDLMVVRPSLYGDVFVASSIDRRQAVDAWLRSRRWILAAAVVATALILAFVLAVVLLLRQRERLAEERVRSGTVLAEAVEAMSDGFVMWDGDDRLVTCNQRYRDLYARSASFIVPGADFAAIIRAGVSAGQYPEAAGREEAFLEETVEWHRAGRGQMERLLPDGRWLLITERRMTGGGVVGIRTDVTNLKRALEELAQATERANSAFEEIRIRNEALNERDRALEFIAHHDDLTRLPNRILFRKDLDTLLARADEAGGTLSLLYVDLDRFKDVNDTLGHPVGDQLLREVSQRLLSTAGEGDRVFRLGGDEFAVVGLADEKAASTLSSRIIEAVSRPCALSGRSVSVGASVGIAVARDRDADALLKNADLALYEAKSVGRGTYRVFASEMEARLSKRVALVDDLRAALAEDQFEIAYQPIYDLALGRTCGFEALIRWKHPSRGWISPADFIPLAEETKLIVEIGTWVLRRACMDFASLPADLKVAVNMSPVQLTDGGVLDVVSDALARSKLHPSRLELELTETALVGNDRLTAANLSSLRSSGVDLVLDDFGTGYSSLSHLRNFPLSKIKIDQSFTREIGERSDSTAIVTSIAELATRLGMRTTAEGVETGDQLALIRAAGCTQAQGYLLGRPRPLLMAVTEMGGVGSMIRPSDGGLRPKLVSA